MRKAITRTKTFTLLVNLTLAMTLFASAAPAVATGSAATEVIAKIRERLGLMQPVAAWKAIRDLPVEDIEREKIVVQSSVNKAKAAGIDGLSVKVFFQEQIAAAKEVQSCWMDRWARGASQAPQSAPDLVAETRPRLIRLGAEILESVALALRNGQGKPFNADGEAAFIAAIDVDCLSEQSKRRIYQALAAVRLMQ